MKKSKDSVVVTFPEVDYEITLELMDGKGVNASIPAEQRGKSIVGRITKRALALPDKLLAAIAAHEVGHAVYGHPGSTFMGLNVLPYENFLKNEKEADIFAASIVGADAMIDVLNMCEEDRTCCSEAPYCLGCSSRHSRLRALEELCSHSSS